MSACILFMNEERYGKINSDDNAAQHEKKQRKKNQENRFETKIESLSTCYLVFTVCLSIARSAAIFYSLSNVIQRVRLRDACM